jgi:hypothetical protein
MKKLILLSAVFALLGSLVLAQSTLRIETLDQVDVSNATLNLSGEDPQLIIDTELHLINTSNHAVDILMKKRYNYIVEGSDTYFCISLCYPATVFQSTQAVNLCGGCTLEGGDGLSVHFRPRGFTGQSQVVYTLWPVGSEADSVNLTLNYSIGQISTPEYAINQAAVYPNPASTSISFEYSFKNAKNNYLAISNILGSEVKRYPVSNTQGKNTLSVAELIPGVYFYTIYDGGVAVRTNRLIIKR